MLRAGRLQLLVVRAAAFVLADRPRGPRRRRAGRAISGARRSTLRWCRRRPLDGPFQASARGSTSTTKRRRGPSRERRWQTCARAAFARCTCRRRTTRPPSAFVYREATLRFVDSAHKRRDAGRGLVPAGSHAPGFEFRRGLAAINLRTTPGERLRRVRARHRVAGGARPVGADRAAAGGLVGAARGGGGPYPLGAIIPSPPGDADASRATGRASRTRARVIYDAFLPMTYFTFRCAGSRRAHRRTCTRCIDADPATRSAPTRSRSTSSAASPPRASDLRDAGLRRAPSGRRG